MRKLGVILVKAAPVVFAAVVGAVQAVDAQKQTQQIADLIKKVEHLTKK